jgi:hypothetical protein
MRVGTGRCPQCWIEQGGDIDPKYLLMAGMNQVAHNGGRNLGKWIHAEARLTILWGYRLSGSEQITSFLDYLII